MSKRRVMVIGLDGATWELLDGFMERGLMPRLSSLCQQGAKGELNTVVPPMTATAWTSFVTGKGPGKHGVYDWTEPMANSYVYEPVDSTRIKANTILEIASDHGCRVSSVNLPLTFPCRKINGVAVSGMLTPSVETAGFTWPPDFVDELMEISPGYEIDTHLTEAFDDVLPFCDRLERLINKRSVLVKELLKREDWDLHVTVWVEMDRLQHCIWHFIDPDHENFDPEGAEKYAQRILEIYTLLDDQIGMMVDNKGEDCDIIFISDHGFGQCRNKVFLNTWLAEKGFLKFKDSSDVRGRMNSIRGAMDKLGVDTRKIVDIAKKFGADGILSRQGAALSRFAAGIDWDNTVAFCHGTNSVRINLEGREPMGSVSEADYSKVGEELREALLAMRDTNGQAVITNVQLRDELYFGTEVDRASDVVITEHDTSVWFYYSEGEIPDQLFENSGWASGNHKPNGIFLGVGPTFESCDVMGADIIDIAPTVLAIMGLPIPDDMDGSVLYSALTRDCLDPIRYTEADEFTGDSSGGFSDKQRGEIEERLRGLGYLQ
jgi:predicted AlkP superfamily phosphohydrolase/phosphomutase